MKKTSVYVDGRRPAANGEYPIYIRVYDDLAKSTIKFSTGLTSPVVFKGREFPSSIPNADILTARLNDVCRMVMQVCLASPDCSVQKLKMDVASLLGRRIQNKPQYFVDYIKLMMESKNFKSKTRILYEQTYKKVMGYDAKATFDTIDYNWLMGYEKFYGHMTINGRAISIRNIRAVFNWAIDNGYTTPDKYPFRKYKIKKEQTRKRCLSLHQLRLLRDYPVEEWQEEYRDIFMLQFYLVGASISDVLELRKLTDGRCVYHRKKTGRLYDIEVQPEAMNIINKYRGKGFLINPLDRYKNGDNYIAHMNNALKKIGVCHKYRDAHGNTRYEYDSLFPELTTHWARHTWATIAASIDIPKETIGKALGHYEWDNTTTDIYISFDNRKIDEANRKVIDFVNSDIQQSAGAIILKMFG